MKRVKRYRRETNEAELASNDRVFCIALLRSNLDEATKIDIQNIARNKGQRERKREWPQLW